MSRAREKEENAVLLLTDDFGSESSLIGADLCYSIPEMKRWAVSCHTLLKGEEVVTVTSQDARCLFFFVQLMSTGNFPDT